MQANKAKHIAYTKLPDLDIIQKIQKDGERELLEILYDRYATKVYYKCLGILTDKDTAKDLAHDVMVKVFLNINKFRGASLFSSWVYSITYNQCMDHLRKKKRIPYSSLDTEEFQYLSTEEIELENKILQDLKLTQLEVLLEQLKPDDKMILLMRYQDGFSTKQIAQVLKISESAVKMRLKRSRDKLAHQLNEMQDAK